MEHDSPKRKFKIKASDPRLYSKIHTNIDEFSDTIFWQIRFNLPLDESTVSEKTMGVTDVHGYIMRTDISYDASKNMIIITPLDTYEENIFYLLNISKRVKSKSGSKLKSKIHILFKLYNNQISEYKVLKSNVIVPEPKPRPKNYDQIISKAKVYSFDSFNNDKIFRDKLPYAPIGLNLFISVLGIIMLASNFYIENTWLFIGSMGVLFLGTLHIIFQSFKKELRSRVSYNLGVIRFNKGNFAKAKKYFQKALILDDLNEMAEYANFKVSIYN